MKKKKRIRKKYRRRAVFIARLRAWGSAHGERKRIRRYAGYGVRSGGLWCCVPDEYKRGIRRNNWDRCPYTFALRLEIGLDGLIGPFYQTCQARQCTMKVEILWRYQILTGSEKKLNPSLPKEALIKYFPIEKYDTAYPWKRSVSIRYFLPFVTTTLGKRWVFSSGKAQALFERGLDFFRPAPSQKGRSNAARRKKSAFP